jgi:hypothetical protein
MIMLSQNIFAIPDQDILDTKVELTIFDGQIVHYPERQVESVRKNSMLGPILGPQF